MGDKAKAKLAWQRSLEVVSWPDRLHSANTTPTLPNQNPSEWPSQLLLGLEAINSSKNDHQTEEERAHSFLSGTKLVEKAFNANQKSAAAANALCELFLRKGNYNRVSFNYITLQDGSHVKP
jgi:RNA polymerase-associated protein CTR9